MTGPGQNRSDRIEGRGLYFGLFLVSLATILYELLLTRIFSVTLWYHFAFMAVSVAMFGMTAGALAVYLKPGWFPVEKTRARLGQSSLLFAVTAVLCLIFHLEFPVETGPSGVGLLALAVTFAVVSAPFVFSGVTVCLALTRDQGRVGRLYAADLFGAGAGCAVLGWLLGPVDAPSAVVLAAALAALGAFGFFPRGSAKKWQAAALAVALGLIALFAVNARGYHRGTAPLTLSWAKGETAPPPLYERWNVFSHVRVLGDPEALTAPYGWGLSPQCAAEYRSRELRLQIDAIAGTRLINYRGDPVPAGFLACDVTNLAHHLRRDAQVLVIGAGGGRDVLSALASGQRRVTAVELNRDILRAVNGVFGDFTGHLDRDPRVRFVNDEARSWLARHPEQYDIIQISLIDTWAATAGGAYVLSENSLYTAEAWALFWSRLSEDGLLSVSRWYYRGRPGEAYRMTSLAVSALVGAGVSDPRGHLVLVRLMGREGDREVPDGVATLLLSKRPFTAAELTTVEDVCERLGFEPVLMPSGSLDPTFARIAAGVGLEELYRGFPINISPPTDNQPFFFNMLRLGDLLRPELRDQGIMSFNMSAVAVLGVCLAVVTVLSGLGVIVPLALSRGRPVLAGSAPRFVYFIAIGMGFMLVEISQLQRMAIFLGHPSYSLSVVLFALLTSSGAGSLASGTYRPGNRWPSLARLSLLLVLLSGYGLLSPLVLGPLASFSTPVRVAAVAALLVGPGFFMGMAFPMGMRAALARAPALGPWLWGVNGAASILASVAAVAIAMNWGISTAFWTGGICYLAALAAFYQDLKPSI